MYIEKINSPQDVKALNTEEMKQLAQEMRTVLIKKLSIHGGHFGPNLGMAEAIIALHYVFIHLLTSLSLMYRIRVTATKFLQAEKMHSFLKISMTMFQAMQILTKASTIFLISVTPQHLSALRRVLQRQEI